MSGDVLALVLDALLPGGDGFPAASAIGLADWLRGRADFAAPAQAVVELLPEGFSAASPAGRAAALRDLEHLAAFDRLLVGAYSGYYVHPDVRCRPSIRQCWTRCGVARTAIATSEAISGSAQAR